MNRRLANWRVIVIALGLVALITLIRDFNSRMAELRRLTGEKSVVSVQVTNLVATQIALQTQVAYAQLDEAVQEWAYEEGRMVRPGENLVIPLPEEGETTTSVQEQSPVIAPIRNWELWLSLFFDNLPGRSVSTNPALP
jgi:hypothetical protein